MTRESKTILFTKKRFGFIVAALLTASCAFAQTIEPSGDKGDKNILNHLDGSITLGTTGVGVHVGDYPDGTPYRMEPDANNMVSCKIKVNNFRPYLGFGYGGKLSNRSDRNWISFDCGAMFWGGTPRIITHDGVDLAKDVKNISGKVGDYVSLFKAVKVYPVLELRLTHRIS